VEPQDHDTELEKYVLKELMSKLGKKGGSARTEAQRLARQENARKMRAAKAKKRFGTLENPNA